jgi:hypothetical protein
MRTATAIGTRTSWATYRIATIRAAPAKVTQGFTEPREFSRPLPLPFDHGCVTADAEPKLKQVSGQVAPTS